MPEIVVVMRDGHTKTIAAEAGSSRMETLRNNGVEELLAICGGCCSCATCHVYVDADRLDLLLPMSEDEDELLDIPTRRPHSRLSCQIAVSDAFSGMTVTIVPEN